MSTASTRNERRVHLIPQTNAIESLEAHEVSRLLGDESRTQAKRLEDLEAALAIADYSRVGEVMDSLESSICPYLAEPKRKLLTLSVRSTKPRLKQLQAE